MKIILIIATIAALEAAAVADAPTAEDLYAEGKAAYDNTDYATAIAKWQASYDLSGESGLLFNLAQAYRLHGDCESALATYRRFIATDPTTDLTTDQRPLARDFARELDAKCGTPPALITVRPNPVDRLNNREDRSPQPGRTLRIAGLATSGAGVALFATGLLFGHHAAALGDEVTSACRSACDWAAWKDKDATGRRDTAIGRVLDVAGIAGIAGGAVLYYLGVHQGTITVSPRSHEGGASVSWSGSW